MQRVSSVSLVLLEVRASFTDDASHDKELTNAATVRVESRPNTPATGSPAVTGAARAGETFRDGAFPVADGRVRGAERVVKGENGRWKTTLRPSSNDDVSITLAAGSV